MRGLTSFEDLVAFVTTHKVPHKLDRDLQVVELPSNDTTLPDVLYVRWEKHIPFVTMIQFALVDLPVSRITDLEHAIVVLNNKLDVPGFGLDGASRRLYNRLAIPVLPPDGIDPMMLNQLGMGCVKQAHQFAPAFRAVAQGRSGSDILALAEAALADQSGIALTR